VAKSKYKIGSRVGFLFLGAPYVGIVVEYSEKNEHGHSLPRYLIKSKDPYPPGRFTFYPTPEEGITKLICGPEKKTLS